MPKRQPKTERLINERELKFIDELLVDFDRSRAYLAAFPTTNHPRQHAYRLLQQGYIQDEISKRMHMRREMAAEADVMSRGEVLNRLTIMARFDPRDVCDDAGNPLPISKIPDKAALALEGIDIGYDDQQQKINFGGGEDGEEGDGEVQNAGPLKPKKVLKYRTRKFEALRELAKFHGVTVDKIEATLKGDPANPLVAKVLQNNSVVNIIFEGLTPEMVASQVIQQPVAEEQPS